MSSRSKILHLAVGNLQSDISYYGVYDTVEAAKAKCLEMYKEIDSQESVLSWQNNYISDDSPVCEAAETSFGFFEVWNIPYFSS